LTAIARRLAPWLLLLPVAVAAQDWSGASLRSARALRLPPGYRLDVVARGFRLPQDLAVDSRDSVWLLTQADPAGGAGALVRVPLTGAEPLDLATLPSISIPFSGVPVRVGSVARDPRTGSLYVAEQSGRQVFRVTPDGAVVRYARGLNRLAETRAVGFDPEGRLVVLDFAGRSLVADTGNNWLRELFGESAGYVGPVLYRLRVDEDLPLPRNLEPANPIFPSRAVQQRGLPLEGYVAMLALPTGDIVLSASSGLVDRLRPDGTLGRLTRRPAARVVAAGAAGELYGLDSLGGRILRVDPDGTVEAFVEGLVRPAAVAALPDGSLLVAEDPGRLLRLRPAP
jgi:hypothetical protein